MTRSRVRALSGLYLASLSVVALVGYLYSEISQGLLAPTGDAGIPFRCDDLQSAGGDDSAVIVVFVLFFIPILYRLLFMAKPAGSAEVGVFGLVLISSYGALALASLDCADIFYTAFIAKDVFLMAVLLCPLLAAVVLFVLHRKPMPL